MHGQEIKRYKGEVGVKTREDRDIPSNSNIYYLEYVIRMLGEYYATSDTSGGSTYGSVVEHEYFSMHPFCWCDGSECPWCREVDPQPNFHYKPLDIKVSWYKYIGRGMEINRDVTIRECSEILSKGLLPYPTN